MKLYHLSFLVLLILLSFNVIFSSYLRGFQLQAEEGDDDNTQQLNEDDTNGLYNSTLTSQPSANIVLPSEVLTQAPSTNNDVNAKPIDKNEELTTLSPTTAPTTTNEHIDTDTSTFSPSAAPTQSPSTAAIATQESTISPTVSPTTTEPSPSPTVLSTYQPSSEPTASATMKPTIADVSTSAPSEASAVPDETTDTEASTLAPTTAPSQSPSLSPFDEAMIPPTDNTPPTTPAAPTTPTGPGKKKRKYRPTKAPVASAGDDLEADPVDSYDGGEDQPKPAVTNKPTTNNNITPIDAPPTDTGTGNTNNEDQKKDTPVPPIPPATGSSDADTDDSSAEIQQGIDSKVPLGDNNYDGLTNIIALFLLLSVLFGVYFFRYV